MVSLCPERYLLPLCSTASAPSVSGRWNTGDRNVLSTDSSAPWACAMSAQARISVTVIIGLLGVSTCTSRVEGRMASSSFAGSVVSTKLTVTPFFSQI